MGRPTALVFAFLFAAGSLPAQQVARVEIDPTSAALTAGETVRFTARGYDAAGAVVSGTEIAWFATPFGVGGMEKDGTFHSFRAGEAQVFAIVGGRPARATVSVQPKSPTIVELSMTPDRIVAGALGVVSAVALTEDLEPRENFPIRFSSSDEAIATVDRNGSVTGRSTGTATITAAAGSAVGTIAVEVIGNPVAALEISGPTGARTGDVVYFAASGLDESGSAVSDPPVRWAVSGEGADIYPDGGFVAARPGTFVVTGAVGDVVGTAAIAVSPRVHARRLEEVQHVGFGEIQAGEAWAVNDALYVSTLSDRVYAFDISTPASPVKTDSVIVDAHLINDVSTTPDGRIGVLTREGASNRRNGIVFLDLSDPLHPEILSEYTETVSGGVHSAYIDGHYVYATDDATGSLKIISFEDPSAPFEAGHFDMGDALAFDPLLGFPLGQYLHDVQVVDGLAYLAYWRHGLVILDVGAGIAGGSPEDPRFLSQLNYDVTKYYPPDMLAGSHAVFRYKDYVFLADEVFPPLPDLQSKGRIKSLGRVHVVDVSDIRRPVKVAEYNVQDMGSHNMWVENDVLYIGYYEGGVRAVDVSGELRGDLMAQGREIGAVWTGSAEGFRPNLPMAWGAQPHKGFVYTSDINSGLWVTRLTEPPTP